MELLTHLTESIIIELHNGKSYGIAPTHDQHPEPR